MEIDIRMSFPISRRLLGTESLAPLLFFYCSQDEAYAAHFLRRQDVARARVVGRQGRDERACVVSLEMG